LPDELGMGCPVLVVVLDENAMVLDAEMDLVQSELPTCEWLTIATAHLLRDVELEMGAVEPYWLTNCFDVGCF
jgi:hypothetical protein